MRIANRKVAAVCKGSNDGTTSLPKGVDFGRTNPRQIRRTKPIAMIALFTIISVGCQLGKQHGGGGGGGNNAQLVSITVTPPSPNVVVGEQLVFSGYGTLSDGSEVSGAATWASSSTAGSRPSIRLPESRPPCRLAQRRSLRPTKALLAKLC